MSFKLGTITVRKDRPDRWEATYYVNGHRLRKSFQRLAYPTKGAVRNSLLEWLRENDGRAPEKDLRSSVEEFFSVNTGALRPASVKNYRLHLDRLVKAYGDVSLRGLSLADLEEWLATYERTGVSEASVNQAIRTLRRMWSWAEARGDVSRNIAKGLRFRRVPEKTGRTLTEDEIPRFLGACSSSFRPIAETALYGGLRSGEVVNLKWDAIDLDRSIIEVRNNGDFRTKSGKHRAIPMHSVLKETLSKLPRKSEYVFSDKDGGKLSEKSSYFRVATATAATKAGITRPMCFHSLRHTFATRLLLYAGDIEAARRILGHSDVQTTRMYIHPGEQLVNAVQKVPAAVASIATPVAASGERELVAELVADPPKNAQKQRAFSEESCHQSATKNEKGSRDAAQPLEIMAPLA